MTKKRDPSLHSVKDVVCRNTGMNEDDLISDQRQYKIKDLEKATDMILCAAKQKKHFYIVGDYDVDGVMASAIMKLTFDALKIPATVRLPKRFSEGYGLRREIVDEFSPGEFLITVDNGIAAIDAIKAAKEKGMEVLVTDHHLAAVDEVTGKVIYPDADLIIDPNAIPDSADFSGYCGAGLAYRLCYLLLNYRRRQEHWLIPKLKSLTAIATIADSVPLTWENRRIVREGLKTMVERGGTTKGLFALLCALEVQKYMSEDIIGFKIGPAINAPGRLRDDGAMDAFNLMVFNGPYEEAKAMAEKLLTDNEKRKELSSIWTQAAMNKITEYGMEKDFPIVLYLPGIPEGIIGIIAGRIAEEYKSPCFLLGDTANISYLKGSSRSYGNVHLKKLLDQNQEYLVKYGGHAPAAGLTVKRECLEKFRKALQLSLKDYAVTVDTEDYYDLEIKPKQINEVMRELMKYAPYGEGNPPILIYLEQLPLASGGNGNSYFKFISDGKGVKLYSNEIEAVSYNGGAEYEKLGKPRHVSLIGIMSKNFFMGKFKNQIEYRKVFAHEPIQRKSPLALALERRAQERYAQNMD